MVTVTQVKCACPSCVCIVSLSAEDAIIKDGKHYCSQACADGHTSGTGCNHAGCNCS